MPLENFKSLLHIYLNAGLNFFLTKTNKGKQMKERQGALELHKYILINIRLPSIQENKKVYIIILRYFEKLFVTALSI